MSIDRRYEYYTPVCDFCEARLPSGLSFQEAVEIKKRAGWRTRKDEYGDWVDMCPDCQQAERDGTL